MPMSSRSRSEPGSLARVVVRVFELENKRKQPITGRRPSSSSHLRIVRANVALLKHLAQVRDQEPGWYTSEVLDYLKYPVEYESNLMFTCWACGLYQPDETMTRCHVIARRHGGDDQADNYMLLCDYCHEEQPDAAHRDLQMKWLESRQYFWNRVARHTNELIDAICTTCGSEDLYRAFIVFAYKINLEGRTSLYAERQTGKLSKRVRIQYDRWLTTCRRWLDRMRGRNPEALCRRAQQYWDKNLDRCIDRFGRDHRAHRGIDVGPVTDELP